MTSTSTPPNLPNYSKSYLPKRAQIPPLKVYPPPQLPEPHNELLPLSYELHQDNTPKKRVLLLIPTMNADKGQLMETQLRKRLPHNTEIYCLGFEGASSGVGEQPYNEAGMTGAFNRIDRGMILNRVSPQIIELVVKRRITTIIYAAIESFITRPGWPPARPGEGAIKEPVDYAYIVLYNPVTGVVKTGVSEGVEVPRAYFKEAQKYGFSDPVNEDLIKTFGGEKGQREVPEEAVGNHGKVTVGEIMAANIRDLDKRNWQKLLTNEKACRYRLIEDTLEKMDIPW
ncbi:hypothetical protein QC762_106290 [Podospora pseudocomata]|uniref:Uncharacterized protein n=1 Tax=Podospora pseudocomata TaxID=2093779 RepID=A0ABR0GTM6_9PEZI|nr:hypothetical protein QC762_106290 [Podospora pseudocomata]